MFVASAAAEGSASTGSRRGCGQRLHLHRVPCARVSRRPIPTGRPARAGGWQGDPALRRTSSGRGQHRRRCGQKVFPQGQRWGRRCRGAAQAGCRGGMQGREAGPSHPAPAEPRSRLSARLPLSRLVTGARGQSPSSRPAPPRADWLGSPQPSANPGARCSLRQRQQLWQLRAAPPAPRACSAAAAPWRPASQGTYHLRCSPQNGGGHYEKASRKVAKASRVEVRKERKQIFVVC